MWGRRHEPGKKAYGGRKSKRDKPLRPPCGSSARVSAPETTPSFDTIELPTPLRDAIRSRGLSAPTAVQSLVADPKHAGRDLLASAQTGSGKTLAFGILISRELLDANGRVARSQSPQALVIAPTRELAVQVRRELEWIFEKTGARVFSVTGGADGREEMKRLKQGCEILVATPGRLVDHVVGRKTVKLDAVKVAVLDEGDEMLRLGFREDLQTILEACPKERRTHLFSATLPAPILAMASKYQRDASRVSATTAVKGGSAHGDIEFVAHLYAPGDREAAVVNVLRRYDAAAAIVFCATRAGAAKLGSALAARGFAATSISGELTQNERTRALAALRSGQAKVLVATDVAARGLDLPDVGLVIHADLPNDATGITHRSGRTGRAGKKGVSVLLASRNEKFAAERLAKQSGMGSRWTPLPTPQEIEAADRDRLVEELKAEAAQAPAGDEGAMVDRVLDAIPVRELVGALLRRTRSSMPPPANVRALHPDVSPDRARSLPPVGSAARRFDSRAPRGAASDFRRPAAAPARPFSPSQPERPAPRTRPSTSASTRMSDDNANEQTPVPRPRVSPSARMSDDNADEQTPLPGSAPRATPSSYPGDRPRAASTRPANTGAVMDRERPRGPKPMTLFRVNVGERQKADPRWIMPMVCRRGGITGSEVGAITVGKRSTIVEVSDRVAERFARAVSHADPKDPNVKFSRVNDGDPDVEEIMSTPRPAPRAAGARPATRGPTRGPAPRSTGSAVRPKPAKSAKPPKAYAQVPEGYDGE